MNPIIQAIRKFRPKPETLARLIEQIPAETIADMARDTIADELGLGQTPENQAGRDQQIIDALLTIEDAKKRR